MYTHPTVSTPLNVTQLCRLKFPAAFYARPVTPTLTACTYRSLHHSYAADDLNCVWSERPGAAVINDEKTRWFCIQRESTTFERGLIFDLFRVAICHPEYWLFLFTPRPQLDSYMFICFHPRRKKKKEKKQNGACWHKLWLGFSPCFAFDENVIPHIWIMLTQFIDWHMVGAGRVSLHLNITLARLQVC